MNEVQFIENSRGSRTLVYNDYMYSLKNNRGDRSYWNCVQSTCQAKLNTHNDQITKVNMCVIE